MSKAHEQSKLLKSEVTIRHAAVEDIDAVYEIAVAGRLESWSRDAYANYAVKDAALFLVAEAASGICGFAVVGIFPTSKEGEIHNIAVAPASRRQGIGTALLREIGRRLSAKGIENLFLEVRESNFPAVTAYEKFGFEIVGRRPQFYKNPLEDAFVMRKSLQHSTL